MKDKCTLTDKELIQACEQWVSDLCESGGKDWCLSVPVNFNRDPDMLFSELIKRFSESPKQHAIAIIKGLYKYIDFDEFMDTWDAEEIYRKAFKNIEK